MARLRALSSGTLFVLVLVITTQADDKCRTGCHGKSSLFKYAEGTTYKYNFESSVDISVSTAEGQSTSTRIKGVVLLTQQANCNQILRLQNVLVFGPDAKKYDHLTDIEKAVGLNFHDGHVEDVICTESGDTQNSLNVKRAIASLFQVNLNHAHETDVFGLCPTDVSSSKEGPMTIVKKTRSLGKCAHRESIKQDFLATSFNQNSEIKASPLLNADYESEQKIKNGIMDSVTVVEHYLYRPFSDGKNGAKATVTTKLTAAGTTKDSPKPKLSDGKSIIFEDPHPVNAPSSNGQNINNALKEIMKDSDMTVTDKTAKQFNNLVKIMRVSSKDEMLTVYGNVKAGAGFNKVAARRVYMDALFRTQTGDAVEVGMQLTKSKEMNEIEQKMLWISLGFVKHATLNSVAAATEFLDQKNIPREAILGIGALAGRYCKEHDCSNNDVINKLIQKFISKLTANPTNRDDENKSIAVLKGLANIGQLYDPVLQKIIAQASDQKAPNRLRVAALEAFMADACKDKLRDAALKILKDRDQDSEIRIKAYLVVAQCPNAKIATAIKELLDTEPVYQVGGFIVSHLRNIRASANPDKDLAKQQLGNIRTTNKFPADFRKYSYNNEFSYSIESLGIGSSVESNTIFSQTSFLPRSTCMNLTAEVFGHTFNLLEVDTRQENLDRLVEHYFGPAGVLKSSTEDEILLKSHKSFENLIKQIKERTQKLRKKRDVSKGEIDAINKQVVIKTNKLNNDLDLDLSVKLFGTEMLFLSINDDADKYTPSKLIDLIFDNINQGIDKAKNFQETLRSNTMFMDVDLSYPTSMGYPLRISVEGTSSVQIAASGQIDIRAMINNPLETAFQIQIVPSGNVDLSTSITVVTPPVETGLKVSSSLHTSTGSNVDVKLLEKGKGIDIKFGIPLEKLDIVSARHDVVFETRELGKPEIALPIKFSTVKKEFMTCFDQLSPIIGLTFCSEGYFAKPGDGKSPVPLAIAGNSLAAVRIERDDMSQYHFRALVNDNPDNRGAKLTIESLGEKKDKKISLEMEAQITPEIFVKATLISPMKTAELEGRVTNTNTEKSISAKLKYDQTELYGKAGVKVTGNDAKSTYKPLIEYRSPKDQSPQQSPYTVEGQIIAERSGSGRKYIFENVKLISPGASPILIQGNLGIENTEHFSGFTDMKVTVDKDFASLKGKIIAHVKPDKKVHISAEMKNSLNPNANFNINLDASRTPEVGDVDLVLIHGGDLNSKINMITYKSHGSATKDKGDDMKIIKTKLSYPLMKLDAKLDAKSVRNNFVYDAAFNYDKFKLASELKASVGPSYNIDFYALAIDNKVELKAKRTVTGDQSAISHMIGLNGKKLEVDGTVVHKVKGNDVHVGADLVVKCPKGTTTINGQYIASESTVDTNLKVSSGPKNYIDMALKANKAGNANGHLKVIVPEELNVDGQVAMTNGAGTASLVLDITKIKRKIKADSTFTISSPVYNVKGDLYLDFDENKKKKISFNTVNKVQSNNFDSQNEITIFETKLVGNIKGSLEGKMQDGKLRGEVEMILPNDRYLAAKIDREIHIINGIVNGNGMITLEDRPNKNAQGKKIVLKGTAKDANIKESTGELTHNIVAEDGQGHNINIDMNTKRVEQKGKFVVGYKLKASGTALPNPIDVDVNAVYKEFDGNYDGIVKYGAKTSLKATGKYNLIGKGQPYTGDMEVELHTPNDKYKVIKIKTVGSLNKPTTENDAIELSGSAGLSINNENSGEIDGTVKASPNLGNVKLGLKLPKEDPISLAVGYGHTETGGIVKCNGNVEMHYGKDKTVKGDITMNRPNPEEVDIDLKLETPAQNAKNTRVQLKMKKMDDGKHLTSNFIVTVDGKKYSLDNEMLISDVNPSLNIVLEYPDGKKSQISAKFNKLAPKKFNGELIIKSVKDFDLDASGEANLSSVEEFEIRIKVNSPKLKLDQVEIEVFNKAGAKGGKRIQFSAKSGKKNLLSGSTSYKAREEGGKTIIEGSGTFMVKEESKSGNFKYIRQQLTQDKNGEEGIQIQLNAGLGSKAIDSELKITNKQFRILNSYCEEKKECAHIEIDSKTTRADVGEFNNELEIAIDLRKLGLSHEFGLKAVTVRKDFILDHTVDVHFQSDSNSKYQYSLYVHPHEAGVMLTTPKRVISIEATMEGSHLPGAAKKTAVAVKGGMIKGQIVIYLNKKNEPNQKTVISGIMDAKDDNMVGNNLIEIKFSNPALSKDLSVKYTANWDLKTKYTGEGHLEIDIFANKNQAIIVNYKTSVKKLPEGGYSAQSSANAVSKGLNVEFNYLEEITVNLKDFSYLLKYNSNLQNSKCDCLVLEVKANEQQVKGQIRVLNKDIYSVVTNIKKADKQIITDTEINVMGIKPTVCHIEVKNYNTLKMIVYRKDKASNKIEVHAGLIIGQIADFRAEVHENGAKIDLVHATINLDEQHFLKSDYGINLDNIHKHILAPMRTDVTNNIKELKPMAEHIQKELSNNLNTLAEVSKKSSPNFKPLVDYYQTELTKLREELVSDKTIKEILDFIKSVFGAVAHTASEILQKISSLTEKLVTTFQENFAKITELINKEILPQVKELADRVITAVVKMIEGVSDLVFLYLAKISELLKEYQGELKQIATSVSSTMSDVGRLVVKQIDIIYSELMVFAKEVFEQIKALPVFEQLREQWKQMTEGLVVPDQIINTIKEIASSLKDGAPTKELKNLIQIITEYLEKKLRQQQIDDMAWIQKIVDAISAVFRQLTLAVDSKEINVANAAMPATIDFFKNLPKLAAVKFSPLNWLASGDFPRISDMLYTFTPRTCFKRYGLIAQGQHIFTFDNRHLTFPATKCSYLLVRDAVDGNFTLAGSYANGKLTAITLSEKGETITVKVGGQATFNNKAEELPIRKSRLVAYRQYESITLRSKSGIRVTCGPELTVCGVEVSGFYHGKMRGLLGNGNNEPYDDFIMPNGKTSVAENEFGNSYKMSDKCPEVKTVDHHTHHPVPECTRLFTSENALRMCYPFVNTENFKMACEHGVAAKVPDTEQAMAIAYVAVCNARGVPVKMPSQFVKCKNSDKPMDVGTTFSEKTPAKSADIVLIVEQDKQIESLYKDLMQPMIQQLTNELRGKGINNVQFSLIGYGGENQKWPSHYTVGNKLEFSGKVPAIKFTEAPKKVEFDSGCPHFNKLHDRLAQIKHEMEVTLSQTLRQRTADEAFKYPFRTNAVKAVIALMKEPCERANVPVLQLAKLLSIKHQGIITSVIAPLDSLKITSKPEKFSKTIAAITKNNVYLIDAKKKQGLSDIRKDVEFTSDPCLDAALMTNGVVVAGSNVKGDNKKDFAKSIAQVIANQLTEMEQGFDCECKMVSPYTAQNICKVVHQKEKEASKGAAKKGGAKG